MIIALPRETAPGERRVALTPSAMPTLRKEGCEVLVQAGAGVAAGFPDAEYEGKEARIVSTREEVFREAAVLCQLRTAGANPRAEEDLQFLRPGQVLIGLAEPLTAPAPIEAAAQRGVTLFALELLPRITRAQSMDVLSSQATAAGYAAVLLAATRLPKMFPMLMTAAGAITPARILVIGAGVAGLQAIATARRLGGVVTAYDIRPAVREQVESLGARFLEIEMQKDAETKGGYAREMDEAFYRRQREAMTRAVAESDVVITTAAVPGKRSPVLVTGEMARGMRPGSVIVDLAAERGGNCELTRADEEVEQAGVLILGPTNLPASVAADASRMFSKNVTSFVEHLMRRGLKEGELDREDEIVRETLVTLEGEIVHERVRERHARSPSL